MMKITIGKNRAAFEKSIFAIQIVLTKKLSLNFQIAKPVKTEYVLNRLSRKSNKVMKE